ncbi:SSI family serine proteinase inhibitor [Streptomyces cavernae]|uniref:SSI family serine proteinase inhibitor n=1 Tax=Streptomyces cavernae TaxID=2259034 RepID=UPI000FEB60D5
MLRHLALTAAASIAALASLPGPAHAAARAAEPADGHLTITYSHTGEGAGVTYDLRCRPAAGSHPTPDRACDLLEKKTVWGKSPFAPLPEPAERMCTMINGGPATAHITGTWAGRPVDAHYDRTNGCQIERWDALVPVLPDVRAQEPGPHTTPDTAPVGPTDPADPADPAVGHPARLPAKHLAPVRGGKPAPGHVRQGAQGLVQHAAQDVVQRPAEDRVRTRG